MIKKTNLKDFLKDKLTLEELNLVNRSFEIVGNIAIVEIDKRLENYQKIIGESILKVNSNIKTVLKKSGIHKGEFRTQDLIYIAGVKTYQTIYLENGIRLKLDPSKVYFSTKLSTERANLMKNLKDNQKILVMFSGCGPYCFTASKINPNVDQITGIEINEIGHKFALENLKLNKNLVKKSTFYQKTLEFLKNNQIPIYEKKLIEIFNYLKYDFRNCDVKVEVKNLKLNLITKKIQNWHNELFSQKPKDIFLFLMQANFKSICIDFDKNNIKDNILENINFLITIFSEKFDFFAKIDNKIYSLKTNLEKSYLINYLKNKLNQKSEDFAFSYLYDEIFMPLPKDAENFLESAFFLSKKNTIIHMYDFILEKDFPTLTENKIIQASKKFGFKVKILNTRKVGQYSPRKYRVCSDFQIIDILKHN